jgi:transcriptional regulator with XRE-family HTH domain
MVTNSELKAAVRELRQHFGETQQQFASRLNSAVITVARWETTRPPSGPALEQLHTAALAANVTRCEQVFKEALDGNVELRPEDSRDRLDFLSLREKTLALALVTMLRDPERHTETLKAIEPALRKCLDGFKAVFDAEDLDERLARVAVGMYRKGALPERIAEKLGIGLDAVEKIVALYQFALIRPVTRVRVHAVAHVRKAVVSRTRRKSSQTPKPIKPIVPVGTMASSVQVESNRRKLSQTLEHSLQLESNQK